MLHQIYRSFSSKIIVVTICPPYSFYLPSEWWMRKETHTNFELPSAKIIDHLWIVHISKSVIQGCGKRWRVLPHKKCRRWFLASLHSSQMDLVADFVNYCNWHNSSRLLIYTGKLSDFNFLLFASFCGWSCPTIHGREGWWSNLPLLFKPASAIPHHPNFPIWQNLNMQRWKWWCGILVGFFGLLHPFLHWQVSLGGAGWWGLR